MQKGSLNTDGRSFVLIQMGRVLIQIGGVLHMGGVLIQMGGVLYMGGVLHMGVS